MNESQALDRDRGMLPVAGPRTVRATRYVTPFREGGSLPGLVEADDDGLYVVKFRGAAQGPRALVAELLAGELGRAIGLPVPELVFVEIDPALAAAEPDYWVRELLEKSPGTNIGLDFLPGSLTYSAAADVRPTPELAADVVWFDSLVTNADRSPRNPNILAWHRRLYLIDHGAALFIHHSWQDPDAHARRPLSTIRDHVLLPRAGSIVAAHDRLGPLVTQRLVRDLVSLIPDAWLEAAAGLGDATAQRAAYVRYLAIRLEAHAEISRELDEARRAG
ncbi:MAG TPA: HipA family kinase [Candidatus Limnocylindrales bacterium]|nr:HipA family kinase [Candidatus Limnocylindrales bacterium]